MPTLTIAERLLLLVALAGFLGLAFEGVYKRDDRATPGGIRTFPIAALAGAALYLIEPARLVAFAAGLVALAAWLYPFLRRRAEATDAEVRSVTLIVPLCALVAYALGPVTLSQPAWIAVALTIATALFVSAREQLHRWVRLVPREEVLTAAQFLVLVGIVLPIVPHRPVIPGLPLTPFQVWLAVVAVCTTSYVSYLVQRYVPSRDEVLLPALMGGFYSSTATTVVLARRLKAAGGPAPDLVAGIVAATAIMYLRIDVVVALFDPSLALDLAPPLLALALIGALTAWLLWRRRGAGVPRQKLATGHPLQLTAAAVFAVAFVAVSALANWIKGSLGAAGLIALALVVGFADVDPFVVSMAQQGAAASPTPLLAAAVMAAASSNNVLKGGYALGFGGRRAGLAPALALVVLGAIGFAVAAAYLRFGAALMP